MLVVLSCCQHRGVRECQSFRLTLHPPTDTHRHTAPYPKPLNAAPERSASTQSLRTEHHLSTTPRLRISPHLLVLCSKLFSPPGGAMVVRSPWSLATAHGFAGHQCLLRAGSSARASASRSIMLRMLMHAAE